MMTMMRHSAKETPTRADLIILRVEHLYFTSGGADILATVLAFIRNWR